MTLQGFQKNWATRIEVWTVACDNIIHKEGKTRKCGTYRVAVRIRQYETKIRCESCKCKRENPFVDAKEVDKKLVKFDIDELNRLKIAAAQHSNYQAGHQLKVAMEQYHKWVKEQRATDHKIIYREFKRKNRMFANNLGCCTSEGCDLERVAGKRMCKKHILMRKETSKRRYYGRTKDN